MRHAARQTGGVAWLLQRAGWAAGAGAWASPGGFCAGFWLPAQDFFGLAVVAPTGTC